MDSDSSATPPATIATATTGCRDGELPFIQTKRPDRNTTQPDGGNHGDTNSFTRSFISDQHERARAPFQNQQRIPNVKLHLFDGQNISRFLKRFEMEFRSRGHDEETMAEYLPMYCNLDWIIMIEDMPGCKTRDWSLLKQSMKDAFCDEEKHKYSLASLRRFVAKLKQRGKPDRLSKVSRIYFKFTGISTYLKDRHIIGVQEESRYFLSILPEEIVDMIHSRRDTRRLVKNGGNDVDDDECALPPITEIIKEVRSIYADFARRGKLSKIRSRREPDSDTESDSDLSEDSQESASSDEDDIFCKPKKSRSHSSRSHSKRGKSSKTSDSDRGYEKTRSPTPEKRKEEPKPKDDPMKDLLLKFSELQVTVAQLAIQAQAGSNGGNQSVPFVRRNSFSNGTRPPIPPQNQNPNAGRWNAPRRDAPPHESNAAAYESTYYSNYAGTGTNAVPINQAGTNQWGGRPQMAQDGSQGPTNGNFGSTSGPSHSVNGPFTPNGGQYAPRPPPLCLWCAGEDGEPHWMHGCVDLTKAIKDGIVRRDPEGKLRYGSRYIPGRGHPRGMRAWVREQEEFARETIRDANNERNKDRVRFGKDVQVNSIEYDPPEIDEHTNYESGNVQVDEYEVNQTKRPRSGTSADIPPPKSRTPRAYRAQDNLFEDLGVPRTTRPAEREKEKEREKDVEMKDAPKQRAAPPAPRPKLESAVESKSDPRAFLDKILQQPITIPMSIMLANSPELAKLMVAECRRKRTPLNDTEVNHLEWEVREGDEPQVNLNSYEGNKKSYYAGVLAFANITIEGEVIKALLDNGSMICMMQDEVRKRLGLPIRTDGSHRVRMAGGGLETLLGISENIPVRIGGVTTYVHFFISKGSSNPILLGQNFLRQVEARFSYHADGSVMMGMTFKGRRITVEVTGKDESRYLSHVPGESREYDSAMVAMIGSNNEDRRVGQFCAWCVPTHQVQVNQDGRNPCGGQHVHPGRITQSQKGWRNPRPEKNMYNTRNVNKQMELNRTDAFRKFTASQFGTTQEGQKSENHVPREITNHLRNDESEAPKRQRVRKDRGRKTEAVEPHPHRTEEPVFTSQPTANLRWSDEMEIEDVILEQNGNGQPVVYESRRGETTVRIQYTDSPEVLEKRQQRMIAAAAEEAIACERERQEELRRQLGERTAPWIQTCTQEEATARAKELRDEYDRFLEVLFGRKIRLEKKLKTEQSIESETPDAHPQPDYPPSAPRKERECGSMMFPGRTLRRYKSIDMAKFTHEYRNIGEESEPIEVASSTTGAASELLPFEMDDWIDEEKARIKEDEDAGDLENSYQRLCAEDEEMKISRSRQETPSQIKDDEAVITELGLEPSSSITPSKQTTEDLITELGMCIEGCVFTANLVELVNPEESFPMEEDWPTPGDEDDSDASGFDVDDDFYYSMTEGVKNVHLDSGDEGSRALEDREESAAAYGIPTSHGKWRRDKQDSSKAGDKTYEESSILSQMIQNSRDRRERLIKVARAQIDAHRDREFETTQALNRMQVDQDGSGSTYSSNSVEINTAGPDKKEMSCPPKAALTMSLDEIQKGFEQRYVSKDIQVNEQNRKFKTKLESYKLSSSSGKDDWAAPKNGPAGKRNKTRREENTDKTDQRTLRELREDLNTLLFDVSSVNLRSQSSRSGKVTPLVNN